MKTYLQEKLTNDQMDVLNGETDLYLYASQKGTANGVATLGQDGKVPSSELPSYVDDVVEYDARDDFPTTGESGKIYVDKSTDRTYRWSGSTYVQIGGGLVLGETASTAYRGDYGKAAYTHTAKTDNPHSVTASQVGLGNVPNVATNNQTPTFSEASTRANINSGETLATLFGKIKKWFSSLGTMAFETAANYVSTSRKINNKALSADITLVATDIEYSTGVTVYNEIYGMHTAINGKQDALGYTPYNATNPSGYQTAAQVTAYVNTRMGSDENGVWIDV